MKNLIIVSCLFLLISNVFACRNQVPESEAQRYITSAALGEGVPALYACADKPEELCLCFDEIEGWDVAKVVEIEESSGLPGQEVTIKRKQIVNDPDKMAAKAIKVAQDKILSDAKTQALKELQNCQNAHATFKARKAIQGLSDSQKIQLATSLEVKKVVDALGSCSIPYAKLMITNYPVDDLVTAEDKAEMISELDN